jgi:hypothetical protein
VLEWPRYYYYSSSEKYNVFTPKIRAQIKEAVSFTPIPTTGSADGTQLKHSRPK